MIKAYKTKTNLYIGGGILAFAISRFVDPSELGLIVQLLSVAAPILLVIGCAYYAKAKGHHPAWGLLGLLPWFIGLVALISFKDNTKNQQHIEKGV